MLYGEMAGSWILHLALPILVSTLITWMPYMELGMRVIVFVASVAMLSFVVQFAFLTALQANSCQGVKEYRTIFFGSLIAMTVTAVMVALPSYVQSLRLVVSQLFVVHQPKGGADVDAIVEKAGLNVLAASAQTGGGLRVEEYEEQTFRETWIGASFWSAFAGAYGVGLGSLLAAKCPASK